MKITKEDVQIFIKVYPHMLTKAEEIWGTLQKIEPNRHEYFSYVDYLSVDEDNLNFINVSGWDGSGSCSTSIPKEYFHDEDWFEEAKRLAEERAEQKKIEEELRRQQLEIDKHNRERKEYERLKAKFENE
jgi:hypothetical protein